MVKLHKIKGKWYLVDTVFEPEVDSLVIFNGEPTSVIFVDTENEICIVEVESLGMTKNTGFDTVDVIIEEIDVIHFGDFLSSISRLEVIDEKGRSYVKYLKTEQRVSLSFQDDDRTLKVFVNEKNIP